MVKGCHKMQLKDKVIIITGSARGDQASAGTRPASRQAAFQPKPGTPSASAMFDGGDAWKYHSTCGSPGNLLCAPKGLFHKPKPAVPRREPGRHAET